MRNVDECGIHVAVHQGGEGGRTPRGSTFHLTTSRMRDGGLAPPTVAPTVGLFDLPEGGGRQSTISAVLSAATACSGAMYAPSTREEESRERGSRRRSRTIITSPRKNSLGTARGSLAVDRGGSDVGGTLSRSASNDPEAFGATWPGHAPELADLSVLATLDAGPGGAGAPPRCPVTRSAWQRGGHLRRPALARVDASAGRQPPPGTGSHLVPRAGALRVAGRLERPNRSPAGGGGAL